MIAICCSMSGIAEAVRARFAAAWSSSRRFETPPRSLPIVVGDRLVVEPDRALRDLELEVQLAELEVGRGHVGHQGDQHPATALVGGQEGGECRLLFAPDAAEEIDLPGEPEAGAPVLVRLLVPRPLRRLGEPRSLLGAVPPGQVDLREQERFRDPGLGAGLLHAGGGHAQVEVLRDALANQGLELRVLRHLPPRQVGQRLRLGRSFQEAVLRGRRHLRPVVVRTDRAGREEHEKREGCGERRGTGEGGARHLSALPRGRREPFQRPLAPRACLRRSASRPPRTAPGSGTRR